MLSSCCLYTLPTNLVGKGLSYTVYPRKEDTVDAKKTPIVFAHGVFGSKELFDSVSKQISIDGRKHHRWSIPFDDKNEVIAIIMSPGHEVIAIMILPSAVFETLDESKIKGKSTSFEGISNL
ncbi:hypothetical protein RRG08_060539 [Elysia crispata]|uniref:Uncharacterized protein n=1 Tax=Elysia crispata TaxID=231223 RepID=A0AAE0YYQ7_9GAST|nr:hypothetical protein RRG08_060539 [Elysia crispata]